MLGVLESRVSVITGGSRGTGKAIARAFPGEGSAGVLAARDAGALDVTVREMSEIGPRLLGVSADVASEADVGRLVERALSEFGRIDALVNCAGVYGPIGPSAEVGPGAWWDTLRTNLLGTFLATRFVLPQMLRQRRGKIINLAGGGGRSPLPRVSPPPP